MTPDIADIIAGELKVSRGTAYDMMREALKEASPVQELVAWHTVHKAVATTIEKCKAASGMHRAIDLVVNAVQITHDTLGADTTPPAAQPAPVPPTHGHEDWVLMPIDLTNEEAEIAQSELVDMDWCAVTCFVARYKAAIEATRHRRAAMPAAEPQPVPVKTYHDGKPWPVAPKPWVGLTDDDIHEQGWNLSADRDYEAWTGREFLVVNGVNDFARALETKLREKNHDQ